MAHLPPVVLLLLLGITPGDAEQINPVDRPLITESLARWTFDRDEQGWAAEHDCVLSAAGGILRIESTGNDPYFHRKVDYPGGKLMLKIIARGRTGGAGEVFWTSSEAPRRDPGQSARFPLSHDGRWQERRVQFDAPGRLTDLRIDPGTAPGRVEIDSIELLHAELHPLGIERIEVLPDRVRVRVKNHRSEPLAFTTFGAAHSIRGGGTATVEQPVRGRKPLEAVEIELTSENLPPVSRTIFLHHGDARARWLTRRLGSYSLRIAADGTVGRIEQNDRTVALLGPIVHCDGKLPKLKLVEDGPAIRFQGEGVSLRITPGDNELAVSIAGDRPCEGPVVRVPGPLQQGLFAGLEYLGKGERSSSKLDITTGEHLRFAPDPMKVTMPLMAVVSDRSGVAMSWFEMTLGPVFAAPNFFDCTGESRMALRGRKIDAVIRLGAGLEEAILWAVQRKGLPPLPKPPRNRRQQWQLCLEALNGPLRDANGWGHCVEERWPRKPFASMASTIFRLSGEIPEMPKPAYGGSHVRNGTIYFVTGRAGEWLEMMSRQAKDCISRQQTDGSYRYDGKYRRGHFEDTASGVCARPAAMLLEYAWVTGDREAMAAGIRTLEYMKRFRTPRGAQVWEIPLHTPDLLASAYSVWACVRGYELTGNKEYLEEARRWATTGVPFVYLWGCRPMMLYATVPVYGATNWTRPNWMGRPVQWVGGVYAYALTRLAPYDDSFDWNHLARGILISAEQQQYPDGPYLGCLPDAIDLETQRRCPWTINPCSLVSLRLVLDGELDFLSVAAGDGHRVAAPFPVTIRSGSAHIEGTAGVDYQVIIDGKRIVDVKSQGDDVLPLE